jgi:serine acetyltransferase
VISDIRRYRSDREPSVGLFVKTTATNRGFVASSILRAQQTLTGGGWHRNNGGAAARRARSERTRLCAGCGGRPVLLIYHPNGMVIGCDAVVSAGCILLQYVTSPR